MKRLTEYTIPETGFSVVSEEKYKRILMEEKPSVEKVYNRLKKIEDILGDEYDLDRLRELLEACKGLEPSEIAESKLLIATRKDPEKLARMAELVEADRDGRCVVLPCKVEDDVYINILGRTLPFTVISISQMSSTPTFKAQHGIRLVYIFKADDVGETVFQARAEAQAALRREQE